MKMIVAERRKGLFYARLTRDGTILGIGSDKSTKTEAISALVLEHPRLFGILAFADTTVQQMVPPPKQTSPS